MGVNSGRIYTAAIVGAFAGFLVFAILNPGIRAEELASQLGQESHAVGQAWIFGLNGLLIGLALALADELTGSSGKRILFRALLGAGLGGALGHISGTIAQLIFSGMLIIFGDFALLPARTLGWALLGAGVGIAVGLTNYSARRVGYGIVGGLVGGGLGGILFDAFGMFTGSGTISRLIGFTAIGAFTGAAVMLIEESRKIAWVTRLAGKNEGKQFVLSRPITRIGRDELLEIPVFADNTVARLHAQIVTSDWRGFQLVNMSGGHTLVNNVPVNNAVLKDADLITIGQTQMLFNQKGAAPTVNKFGLSAPTAQSSNPYQYTGTPSGSVCNFCGQPKDPITGLCPCSPESPTPAGTPASTPVPTPTPLGIQVSTKPLLAGLQGPYSGSVFELSENATIGRDCSNAISLSSDPLVSRMHAVISLQQGNVFISDSGSTNGIYINGIKASASQLNPGDKVRIGNTIFELRC